MTRQEQRRPLDELAAAIYETVSLSASDDAETLALQYRDRLAELLQMGRQHQAFTGHCAGSVSAFIATETDPPAVQEFRSARDALQGEQLASLDAAEIHRQLDQHLRHICRTLAQEFLTALEREAAEGRIGQMQRVGESIGRCTLPQRARGNQFDDPLSAMIDSPDDLDTGSSSTAVEFFIAEDVLLVDAQRSMRRFRPLQLIFERATLPLRQSVRLVTGKRYRSDDELAKGRFTAVVLFDYVLDFWTDDQRPVNPGPTRTRSISLWQRVRGLPSARASTIPLAALIALTIAVVALDYHRAIQVADLQQQVDSQQDRFTKAKPDVALERRVHALEQQVAALPAPAAIRRATTAVDSLTVEIAALSGSLPSLIEQSPMLREFEEGLKTFKAEASADARGVDERITSLSDRIAIVERDTTQHDRLAEPQRPTTSDVQSLRQEFAQLRTILKTTQSQLATLQTSRLTSKHLASVQQQAASDVRLVRAELSQLERRIDLGTSRVTKRLDALDGLLSGDTHASGVSTVRSAAQMRKRIQNTPSQRVVDELHRLMSSDEPYEVVKRSDLITERWALLWSTSVSIPYVTRATMLLQEIHALSQCKNLQADARDALVVRLCRGLSLLTPGGEQTDTDTLVALTIHAQTFHDKYDTHRSAKNEFQSHLTSFVMSVGQFVDKQRLSVLTPQVAEQTSSETAVAHVD